MLIKPTIHDHVLKTIDHAYYVWRFVGSRMDHTYQTLHIEWDAFSNGSDAAFGNIEEGASMRLVRLPKAQLPLFMVKKDVGYEALEVLMGTPDGRENVVFTFHLVDPVTQVRHVVKRQHWGVNHVKLNLWNKQRTIATFALEEELEETFKKHEIHRSQLHQ